MVLLNNMVLGPDPFPVAEGAAPGRGRYCGVQEIQRSMGVRRRNVKLLLGKAKRNGT